MTIRKKIVVFVLVMSMSLFSFGCNGSTGDKTALNTAIVNAEALNQGDFTPDTWWDFSMALAAAIIVRDNAAATQSQVDDALSRLVSAQDALARIAVMSVNRVILNALIIEVETFLEFIPDLNALDDDSLTTLNQAILSARNVRDAAEVTQAQVDTAHSVLQSAFNGLLYTTGETAAFMRLVRKIAQMEGLIGPAFDEPFFTELSWRDFMNALTAARNTASNPQNPNAAFNRDYTILTNAHNNLAPAVPDTANMTTGLYGMQWPQNPAFPPPSTRGNPQAMWNEFGAHDPAMIKVGAYYYVFSTDIALTPFGAQIRRSRDLINWTYIGTAFDSRGGRMGLAYHLAVDEYGDRNPNAPLREAFDFLEYEILNCDAGGWGHEEAQAIRDNGGTTQIWAPAVILGNDGYFWMYYSVSIFGRQSSFIGLAKSRRITGPFVHAATIATSVHGGAVANAIDPAIIFERNDRENGRMWMVYGSFSSGMYILELDPATGYRLGGYRGPNTSPGRAWRNPNANPGVRLTAGNSQEGPVMFYEPGANGTAGWYHLMTSRVGPGGGNLATSYNMRNFRSRNVTGPFVDARGVNAITGGNQSGNKMLGSFRFTANNPGSPNQPTEVMAPGGNELLRYNGKTFAIMHAYVLEPENDHSLHIRQVFFNEDDWMVMMPNRYARESLQAVPRSAIAGSTFKMVSFTTNSNTIQVSQNVVLNDNGTITGAVTGTWELRSRNSTDIVETVGAAGSGYFLQLIIGGQTYRGIITGQYLECQNRFGLSFSVMGGTGSGANAFARVANKMYA